SLPSRPTATDDSLRRQASQRLQRFQPPGEDTSNSSFACSLFAALGDAEDRLFGRNFDWRYSPALLLFTDRPAAGGYASISMVDLAYFSFGDQVKDLTTLPLAARRPLLDAPGWPFDGMNAAGVAVGMAAVPQADERHDPGKPSIDSLAVMREILDRAGNVDEAVAILKGYNIAWEDGPPLHYLVADRGGRAALVEFYGGEIAVLLNAGPWHAMTNFTRSAVAGDAAGQCHRYDTLIRRLTDTSGTLSSRGALGLLQAVAQTDSTQWSVVYGMSTGRVEVVMGRSYGQVYTFRLGER
ncbi:MAG: linear amide C-N hydrolase, partial [Chloroflexi bacterium]|nr:linear amide C-N hydrolase [Chloroflexota bacterium]